MVTKGLDQRPSDRLYIHLNEWPFGRMDAAVEHTGCLDPKGEVAPIQNGWGTHNER